MRSTVLVDRNHRRGGEVLLSRAEPAIGNSMKAVPGTLLTAMAAAGKYTSLFSRIEMPSAERTYHA